MGPINLPQTSESQTTESNCNVKWFQEHMKYQLKKKITTGKKNNNAHYLIAGNTIKNWQGISFHTDGW